MARTGTEMATGYSTEVGSEAAGSQAAGRAVEHLDADSVDFCQVFCSASYSVEAVVAGIREHVGPDAVLVGAASHTPFTERGIHSVGKQSVAVGVVNSDTMAFFAGMGTDLSEDITGCVREAARDIPRQVEGFPHLTAIVIPDGLVYDGEELTMAARKRLGANVRFVGGGAHFGFTDSPVICNGDTAENAVTIALIASKSPTGSSFSHCHEPIADAHEVTRAEGSTVHELDGRPAFEVWKDDVREDARDTFGVDVDELEEGSDELIHWLYHYQYGVDQGNHYKLRCPGLAARTDGPLEFTLTIPEGTVMRPMANTEDGYVTAARDSSRAALAAVSEPAGAFVYDCGCRRQMLGDNYIDSVNGMIDELGIPLLGTEVFGEICMNERQVSGYHNTTAVVLVLPK